MLTPSFFASPQCRRELRRFLDRERRLNRRDLILPVYWVEAAALENSAKRGQDDLAQELAARQYTDWRELRFQQLSDQHAWRALAALATHIRDALDPVDLLDRSTEAIRANVDRVVEHALETVRTCPGEVDLVNLLVDAVRDSGRLPEVGVRAIRWTAQSRLEQPPDVLRESTSKPLDADPFVDPAHADTLQNSVSAAINGKIYTLIYAAGGAEVVTALLDQLREVVAHAGKWPMKRAKSMTSLLDATVRERIDYFREVAAHASWEAAQAERRVSEEQAQHADAAEAARREACEQRDAAVRELKAARSEFNKTVAALRKQFGDRPKALGRKARAKDVVRALDEAQAEIGQLKAEQALLTCSVTAAVNLSRRSQALVERQLRLIDDLENREEDPDQLANLFKLDHLATRMRRNSENLLVLAGIDTARRWAHPVPINDVVLAAISEVEQYTRIKQVTAASVSIAGHAVSDVVHLIAELLENATCFSPPAAEVFVSSHSLGPRAGALLEIEDRGIGMPAKDIERANDRLENPPIDEEVLWTMGLFVVGRLGSRHGITVQLRAAADGIGITAAVRLPPRIVTPPSAGGRLVVPVGHDVTETLDFRDALRGSSARTGRGLRW